jgi:hypothetical protein
MAKEYLCDVVQAGVTINSSLTPAPTVYVVLTSPANKTNSGFQNEWFYAADVAKNQVLATALTALSNGSQVHVWVDPPTGKEPTQIYDLYALAP